MVHLPRGGPRTASDRQRIDVENVIAQLVTADDHLRVALMRLVQGARTAEDRAIINEALAAREAIASAHGQVVELHPNRRDE